MKKNVRTHLRACPRCWQALPAATICCSTPSTHYCPANRCSCRNTPAGGAGGQCGQQMRLHPQYEGLEALYKRYQGRDWWCLASRPMTSARRSGSNKEIAEFCKANYGVSFPMFEKLEVPIGKHPCSPV